MEPITSYRVYLIDNLAKLKYNTINIILPKRWVKERDCNKRRKHMSNIVESSVELIGKTPILRAKRYAQKANATDAELREYYTKNRKTLKK